MTHVLSDGFADFLTGDVQLGVGVEDSSESSYFHCSDLNSQFRCKGPQFTCIQEDGKDTSACTCCCQWVPNILTHSTQDSVVCMIPCVQGVTWGFHKGSPQLPVCSPASHRLPWEATLSQLPLQGSSPGLFGMASTAFSLQWVGRHSQDMSQPSPSSSLLTSQQWRVVLIGRQKAGLRSWWCWATRFLRCVLGT